MIKSLIILKNLIPKNHHKKFILLFFLILLSMIFEILTLNSIFGLISYMTNPDILNKYVDYEPLTKYLSNDNNSIIFGLTSILFIIFLIKILITIFLNFYESKLIARVKYDLSNNFFKGYMSMPKIFHLRTNSAKIIRNITIEVDYLIGSLQSFTAILLEIVVLIGITIFLLLIDYKITLITLFAFFIFMIVLSKLNSKQLINLGKDRIRLVEERLKKISEGVAGINIFELAGVKEKYIESFKLTNNQFTEIGRDSNFRFSLPKPLLELFLLILILLFFVFVLNNYEINYKVFLPTLAVFLGASYRLMPSIAKISHNLQKFKFFIQSADKLIVDRNRFDLTKKQKEIKEKNFDFHNKIIFKNIKFSYEIHGLDNKNEKKIFDSLNFEINKKDKIGIFGSSGSGKSTFLDLFMGLIEPSSGQILIDGKDITSIKSEWHKKIGCVPQDVFIFDTTISKNIIFSSENDDVQKDKILKAITKSNLNSFISNLDNGLQTLIGERGSRISGGEKQRIGIARALYNNPDILIFDESTSSLDKQTENKIIEEIFENNKEKTIIFVSHNLDNLKYCEKIFELKDKNLLIKK